MFEKEAEMYKLSHSYYEVAKRKDGSEYAKETLNVTIQEAFQKGAELGYNKANEWHYVKDGLPPKDGFFLVAFHNIGCDAVDVGQFLQAEWWHMDEEIRVFINKNIYAWKELPNPPKEI